MVEIKKIQVAVITNSAAEITFVVDEITPSVAEITFVETYMFF